MVVGSDVLDGGRPLLDVVEDGEPTSGPPQRLGRAGFCRVASPPIRARGCDNGTRRRPEGRWRNVTSSSEPFRHHVFFQIQVQGCPAEAIHTGSVSSSPARVGNCLMPTVASQRSSSSIIAIKMTCRHSRARLESSSRM